VFPFPTRKPMCCSPAAGPDGRGCCSIPQPPRRAPAQFNAGSLHFIKTRSIWSCCHVFTPPTHNIVNHRKSSCQARPARPLHPLTLAANATAKYQLAPLSANSTVTNNNPLLLQPRYCSCYRGCSCTCRAATCQPCRTALQLLLGRQELSLLHQRI